MSDGVPLSEQDSAIAAALSAMARGMTPETAGHEDLNAMIPPAETADAHFDRATDEWEPRVIDACRELASAGIRPRDSAVRAFLTARFGGMPASEEVAAIIRRWKAMRWKSAEVRTAYIAYAALDAEQRAAFRERADADDHSLAASVGQGDASASPYEIQIFYRGKHLRSEFADRATTAWVKLQNLIDRRPPDVTRLDLIERTAQSPRMLKHWTPAIGDNSAW
ncbi:MAG: hypothetical protein KF841_09350 [Phycisphaerae bacterium]|nr:hypothetical protein [Phycisphaerae bacterium]